MKVNIQIMIEQSIMIALFEISQFCLTRKIFYLIGLLC